MSLYPNPVHHTLHFNVPSGLINKDYEVQVTDMTGRLVTKKESSQLNNLGSYNQEIELSGLESGLYILKLISERQTVSSKKFIFDDDYAR